jgi:TPR repeat protein
LHGNGVTKDPAEAVRQFKLVAKQSHAGAQVVLGSFSLLAFLSQHLLTPSLLLQLGSCYAGGTGVPKDAVECARLMALAAAQGYALGQLKLGT